MSHVPVEQFTPLEQFMGEVLTLNTFIEVVAGGYAYSEYAERLMEALRCPHRSTKS